MHTTASEKADAQERIPWRFRLCLIVALLLLIAGSFYYGLQSRAPVYQGRTAAQWFHEYEKVATRYWTPAVFTVSNGSITLVRNPSGTFVRYPSNFFVVRSLDERALRQDQSAKALRALGTNAALYLGQEYLKEDGQLSASYRKLYAQAPGALQKLLPQPAPPRSIVRMNIGYALDALGQDAKAAVPVLLGALQTGKGGNRLTIINTLQKIPFDHRLVDPILEDWSRKGDHGNVLFVVDQLQVRTPTAIAWLTRAVLEGDSTVRCEALYQLERHGTAAAAALPELIAALTDADGETRYFAARVLVAIGPDAAPAIPALILATTDSSVMVQRASARALRAIRGESQE